MTHNLQDEGNELYAAFTADEIRPTVIGRLLASTQAAQIFNHSRDEVVRLDAADALTLIYCGGIGAKIGGLARARSVARLRASGFEIVTMETNGRYYLRDFIMVRIGARLFGSGPGADCYEHRNAPEGGSGRGFSGVTGTHRSLSPCDPGIREA